MPPQTSPSLLAGQHRKLAAGPGPYHDEGGAEEAITQPDSVAAFETRLGHPPPPSGTEGRGPQHPPPHVLEFRSIDGSGNQNATSQMNVTNADYVRIGPANYQDGVFSLIEAPNARAISNAIVAGPNAVSPEGVSALLYAWGQFIDHDLDLTLTDNLTHIDIMVPADDGVFTPGQKISMTRSVIDPVSGHDGVAAIQKNAVTGWLDASMVYGSDSATATSLRMDDGRLAVSAGNNLPIVSGSFQAGDIRVQENPSLIALQTLFVREHNFQVARLHALHEDWTGETLYQNARAIVTAEIEHITFDEFLPHLLGQQAISPYRGYNPNVNASISVEFSGAAFRFGHSLVTDEINKIAENGSALTTALSLKDSFFLPPETFTANGGADAILRYLSSEKSNALDVNIVDDLRNFLFGPGAGLDLAALNIQRGRDLGLGSLNDTRSALGLARYENFDALTDDASLRDALASVYGSVDQVELWLGGLAEKHLPGSMMGSTFTQIIARQFEALRDGDRLYYENQGFDPRTLQMIKDTSLSDLILRNTDTQYMQDDAFLAYDRHGGAAGAMSAVEGAMHQLIIGQDGSDTLVGGQAEDLLVAAQGLQILTGAGGADVFFFGQAGSRATITDFNVMDDKLEFATCSPRDFGDLRMVYNGQDTIIDFNGDHIALLGVDIHALKPSSFDIHP